MFLSGEVHHAELIRHDLGDGYRIHELVAGPLAARPGVPRFLDRSLGSRSLGFTNNFGEIVADGGRLIARIRDRSGAVRRTLHLHRGQDRRRRAMIELTLEMAEQALRAAQQRARELGAPITTTIVDEAGRLVLSARGDGTGFFTPETSRAKAVAAAAFRRSTTEMAELAAKGAAFWTTVPVVLDGQALPTAGGSPLVRNGRVIGGIGCGGATGEQDQQCADAGAAAIK